MKNNKSNNDIRKQAAHQLLACSWTLNGLGISDIRSEGLRPPQGIFLNLMMLRGGVLTMGTLSNLAQMTISVATRFVERMEKKGILQRVPDKSDRRVVQVRLTRAGKQIGARLLKAQNARIVESLREIEPEELKAFMKVLEQANGNLMVQLDPEIFKIWSSRNSRSANFNDGDEL